MTFSETFKHYRLRSGIATLAEFGDLLAESGFIYETSLFSHWQKNERIPRDRRVIVAMITIFAKRGGLVSIDEANSICAAADIRDLTEAESEPLRNLFTEYGFHTLPNTERTIEASHSDVYSVANYLRGLTGNSMTMILCGFYGALCVWWMFLFIFNLRHTQMNYVFGLVYGLIPFIGGLAGIYSSYRMQQSNLLRKAILYMSLGILFWSGGQFIWAYYNFFRQVEIPSPSWADMSYVLSWPMWGIGLYYLSRASRTRHIPVTRKHIAILSGLSVVTIIVAYYLLVIFGKGGQLITEADLFSQFFDVAYPTLDILIVLEALILYGITFRYIKGIYRMPTYALLITILVNFVADFSFSYTMRNNEFYNGSWVDLIFMTSMFLFSLGINSFRRAKYRHILIEQKY